MQHKYFLRFLLSFFTFHSSAYAMEGKFIDNSGNMDFGKKIKAKKQQETNKNEEDVNESQESFKELLECMRRRHHIGTFQPLLKSEQLTSYKELNPLLIKSLLRSCPEDLKMQISVLKNGKTFRILSRKGPLKNKILLYGPPGSGKSTLAKAIADYCGMPRMFISSASLVDQYKNSGQQNLRELFAKVMRYDGRCALILDEFTGLTDKHNKKDDQDTGLNEVLFSLLDECDLHKNILFIATVNEIKNLPEQIKDRFRRNVYKIDLPDYKRRKQFIKKCFIKMHKELEENFGEKEISLEDDNNIFYSFELIRKDYDYLAKKTNGFSIRDLIDMGEQAIEYGLAKAYDKEFNIDSQHIVVTQADYIKALKKICALKREMSTGYTEWYKEKLKEWGPIIMPVLGLYLQYKSQCAQIALANVFHEQQMTLQRKVAGDQLQVSKNASKEQLALQNDSSRSMFQSQLTFGIIHLGLIIIGMACSGK